MQRGTLIWLVREANPVGGLASNKTKPGTPASITAAGLAGGSPRALDSGSTHSASRSGSTTDCGRSQEGGPGAPERQRDCSRPGKPVGHTFTEAFNGSLTGECLAQHGFAPLPEAEQILEAWRLGHNAQRPQSSLTHRSPAGEWRECHYVPNPDRLAYRAHKLSRSEETRRAARCLAIRGLLNGEGYGRHGER